VIHYIRDLLIPRRPAADYSAAHMIGSYVLFHYLRVMGWEWLWECDTQQNTANHCPDGSMKAPHTTIWTALGTASLSKDASEKHQGLYGLEVDSSAVNDGVRSALLTYMENSVLYYVVLWASNDTGSAWNVDVDDGSGSFSNMGTIPDNSGTWTKYVFSFTSHTSGNRYVRVVDNNGSSGTIYIDDLNIFRSWFEYRGVDQSGSDGDVQNGDEFSSSGYTFVSGDIGKVVVFYDPSNLGNSGAYTIDSINAGNAVLTLRMGGSETLINTSVGNLEWRLLDLTQAPISAYTTGGGSISESGAGWGLESPHASGWRLFFRHRAILGSNPRSIMTWSSPTNAEYDIQTGEFMGYEPSTYRPRGESYDYAGLGSVDGWFLVGNGGTTAALETHKRLYAMVSSGGEFVGVMMRTVPESTNNIHGVFGVSGTDVRHTARESFVHLAKRNGGNSATNEVDFGIFSNDGACGTDEATMPPCALGFWNVSIVTSQDSNNQANPFSDEESLQRPVVLRDYDGSYGFYSEKEFDVEDALWCCRSNLGEFTPFSPVEGTGDSFAFASPTVTLTDSAGDFTADMVGRAITISGSTSPGNDGTFIITSRISSTQITYDNASGVAEAFTGAWSVGPQYFHLEQGVCWKWPGFTAVA